MDGVDAVFKLFTTILTLYSSEMFLQYADY